MTGSTAHTIQIIKEEVKNLC